MKKNIIIFLILTPFLLLIINGFIIRKYIVTNTPTAYRLRNGEIHIRELTKSEIENDVWKKEGIIKIKNKYYHISIYATALLQYILPICISSFLIILILNIVFILIIKITKKKPKP